MNTQTETLTIEEVDEKERTIKTALEVAAEEMTALWRGRAWEVKGYDTWQEYLDGSGLTVAWADASARQQIVLDLREEGMSQRAIADAVGVAQSTVHEDLSATDRNRSVGRVPVLGLDGKVRTYDVPKPKPAPDLSAEAAAQISADQWVRYVEGALVGLLSSPVHGIEEYVDLAGDKFLVVSDWSDTRRAKAHERIDLLFDLMSAK